MIRKLSRRVLAFAVLIAGAVLAVAAGWLLGPLPARPAPRQAGPRVVSARNDDALRVPEAASPSNPPAAVGRSTAVQAVPWDREEFKEEELMLLLKSARGNDPSLCVELAREGNRRFPDSPAASERAAILIHALTEQGLTSEARGEAEDMVNRYPDSPWVREIERFTGAHRHRNVRVDAQGNLSYVDPPPPT